MGERTRVTVDRKGLRLEEKKVSVTLVVVIVVMAMVIG